MLGEGHCFGDIVNICMQNRCCASRALLGGSGRMLPQKCFEKIAALRLNLVGQVWLLVYHPTLVFRITAY